MNTGLFNNVMRNRFPFIVFLLSILSYSQTIKVKNGFSITSIDSNVVSVLDKSVYAYSGSIGMEYLERDRFSLNTEIGYTQKGGKEINPLIQGKYSEYQKKWDYLFLLTTFRYKFPVYNDFLFVGVGPRVDYLLDKKNNFTNTLYEEGYSLERYVIGINPEVGFVKNTEKISYGIEFSYLLGVTKIGGTEYNKLKSNAFTISLNLGYKL
ncbi:MAG: hypothetical protein Q4C75_00580 [Bergeyella zoohelcum]|nr:hypothetical protein [Bergeyella zoohelcum]